MNSRVTRRWLSSKDGREDDILKQRIFKMLPYSPLGLTPALEEVLAWHYGCALTGLSFRVRGDIWTAMVKADFDGTGYIAYVDVGSFARCVEALCEQTSMRNLRWKVDIHPPMTRPKQRRRPASA